jgi:starch phosphorylase
MARLTPQFSASRAIREYTENYYLPAAWGYRKRAAGDSTLGVSLLQWQQDIARHWKSVRFGMVNIETRDGRHFFQVEVFVGDLGPDKLRVELYASPVQEGGSVLEAMTPCKPCTDSGRAQIYSGQVSATRSASDYTPRIVPGHANASVPLEAHQILWQG